MNKAPEHELIIKPREQEVPNWVYTYGGGLLVVQDNNVLRVDPTTLDYSEETRYYYQVFNRLRMLEDYKDVFKIIFKGGLDT